MALTLTSADLARIRAAQSTLLAPLADPTARVWATRVVEVMAAVFGAESGMMLLPGQTREIVGWGLSDDLAELFDLFVVQPQSVGAPLLDPQLERSTRLRLAQGIHTLTYARLNHMLQGGLDTSTFYHELQSAQPHHEMLGLIADLQRDGEPVEGAVHLYCRRVPAFGGDTLDVLDLLLPAVEAGVAAMVDLGARRAALDALDAPLLVCDVDGRVIHETAALTASLDATDGTLIRMAARQLAADLLTSALVERPERTVRTERGEYCLRGTVLPEGASLGPRPGVLVRVRPPESPWPAPEVLRKRFGLTRREAEVARGLAQGLANDILAEALCISPHTARRHTERVMAKLDVVSRAQVAAALLGPEASPR